MLAYDDHTVDGEPAGRVSEAERLHDRVIDRDAVLCGDGDGDVALRKLVDVEGNDVDLRRLEAVVGRKAVQELADENLDKPGPPCCQSARAPWLRPGCCSVRERTGGQHIHSIAPRQRIASAWAGTRYSVTTQAIFLRAGMIKGACVRRNGGAAAGVRLSGGKGGGGGGGGCSRVQAGVILHDMHDLGAGWHRGG